MTRIWHINKISRIFVCYEFYWFFCLDHWIIGSCRWSEKQSSWQMKNDVIYAHTWNKYYVHIVYVILSTCVYVAHMCWQWYNHSMVKSRWFLKIANVSCSSCEASRNLDGYRDGSELSLKSSSCILKYLFFPNIWSPCLVKTSPIEFPSFCRLCRCWLN